MNNAHYPLGTVENGHVLTTKGWVMIGAKVRGYVMTPAGWTQDTTHSGRLGVGLAVGAAGLFIGLVGLVLANASASLMTGTGTNWIGAVITIIAVVSATVALVLLKAPLWTTIVTGVVGLLLVVLSVASVVYLEIELEDRRQEIADLL